MTSFFRIAVVSAAALDAAFAQLTERQACEPLPPGSGRVPFPDTAEAFHSFAPFSDAAIAAPTPAGYIKAYSNLHTTYDEPSQFVYYKNMDSYDVAECAAACNHEAKCNAFTIFFERAPTVEPGVGCANPNSTTLIKCDLWAGTILPSIPLNKGQMRHQFHSVMAGFNAYVKDINIGGGKGKGKGLPSVPADWIVQKYPHGAAIEAPRDCHGVDTYMGMRSWLDGHFDAERCIEACNAAGDHDVQGRKCHFVNTYMERMNNVPIKQHCAMFSEVWPSQFATNIGQKQGPDEIDISDTNSYGIYHAHVKHAACFNATDAPPNYPSASTQSAIIASETFTDWEPVSETTTYSTPAYTPTPSTLTTMVSSKTLRLSLEDILDSISDITSYLDIDIDKTINWSNVLEQTTLISDEVLDQTTMIPDLLDETTMMPEKVLDQATWIPKEILDQMTWLSDLVDAKTATAARKLTKHVDALATVSTPSVPVWTEFA
ncbi:hypothetical protein TW65_06639 [Stemphylium lycopersici]|uniref:Apple domain-containing protein n=1 Tax=Stemphylium lycopersici TaxID=183478 RepID=A0A364N262_STELY|nr:hypothetical protein TW65_06639 [Stemphylium lycopersici]RAR09976.1 hypothetical protein DDE83_005285 [Stemphylium lycopersici]